MIAMHISRIWISAWSLGLIFASGCGSHQTGDVAIIKSSLASQDDPPVLEIRIKASGERGVFEGRGQAIVLNGRFLTAAHVLPEFQKFDSESSVLAQSRPFEFHITNSGACADDEDFRRAAADGKLNYEMVSCDWAMGTTSYLSESDKADSLQVYIGKLNYNAPVSLVRSSSDGRTTQRFDTRVVIPEAAETFPDNLVFLAKPSGFDHHGWSGCFVGEQVRGEKSWKLIGVLSASPTATDLTTNESVELLVVVRPPVSALEWLLGSSD